MIFELLSFVHHDVQIRLYIGTFYISNLLELMAPCLPMNLRRCVAKGRLSPNEEIGTRMAEEGKSYVRRLLSHNSVLAGENSSCKIEA